MFVALTDISALNHWFLLLDKVVLFLCRMNKELQGRQIKKAPKKSGVILKNFLSRYPSSNLKEPCVDSWEPTTARQFKCPFQIPVCLATWTQDNKSAFAYKWSISDISFILWLIRTFKNGTLYHLFFFSNGLDSWGEEEIILS